MPPETILEFVARMQSGNCLSAAQREEQRAATTWGRYMNRGGYCGLNVVLIQNEFEEFAFHPLILTQESCSRSKNNTNKKLIDVDKKLEDLSRRLDGIESNTNTGFGENDVNKKLEELSRRIDAIESSISTDKASVHPDLEVVKQEVANTPAQSDMDEEGHGTLGSKLQSANADINEIRERLGRYQAKLVDIMDWEAGAHKEE
ncbi:hypothetical protein HDK77DRAFT_502582 [Phyllosticta capitalensis]